MEVVSFAKRATLSGVALAAGAAIGAAGAQQHETIDRGIGYVHQDHGRFGNALDQVGHVAVLNGLAIRDLAVDALGTAQNNGNAPDTKRQLSGVEVVVMDLEYAAGAIATGAGAILLFPGTTMNLASALSGAAGRRRQQQL